MEKNIEEIVGFLCQQYERLKSSINFVNDDLLKNELFKLDRFLIKRSGLKFI